MDAALRELNGEIDLATQRLLDDARTLNQAHLREPSRLPGWDRGYVLAHLARGADLMRDLLSSARTGREPFPPVSERDGPAATERAAGRPAGELMTDLADSAMSLRVVILRLPDEAWAVPVTMPGLAPFPASEILVRRLAEVELHHSDLDTGYGPADWSPAFAGLELPEPLRSQRQDRLGYPQTAPTAGSRAPARPVPPWQPGRPLPGSWIGARGSGSSS